MHGGPDAAMAYWHECCLGFPCSHVHPSVIKVIVDCVFITSLYIIFAAQLNLHGVLTIRTVGPHVTEVYGVGPRSVKVHGVGEALCKGLVDVQLSKSSEVVTATADALEEHGFKKEEAQLRG